MRDKGLGTNYHVLKAINMLFYGRDEGEGQQKEAGTQTIGRPEEATQLEAEGLKDTGIQTEVGDPQDTGIRKIRAEDKEEVGTQTEAGDPKEVIRQTEAEQ